MTIKFKMDTRGKAYEAKLAIIKEAEMCDFVTVEDAKRFVGYSDNDILPEDRTLGWRWSDLKGNNIFVRMCKYGEKEAQPYLFLCDPPLTVFNTNTIPAGEMAKLEITGSEEDTELDPELKVFIDYAEETLMNIFGSLFETRRKAMVHHKLNKKTIIERPCWFHAWTNNRIQKDDGTIVDQDLAICEFLDDGHIERIAWDHIRFVDEWE